MRKWIVIAIWLSVLLVGSVIGVGMFAIKPLSVKIGTRIKDPMRFFQGEIDSETKAKHLFRDTAFGTPDARSTFVYITRLSFRQKHTLVARYCTYRLDESNVVTNITCRCHWPVFDF